MHIAIEDLLKQMTIEEKVSLLGGSDMWHTVPISRLGIPALKVTDGPNGARGGGSLGNSTKAACFPAGIALASSWNIDLVRQVGQALGQEAKTKGAYVLLAPTVNIHRSPLNGRNFECFSEDPYLSARMAVAYITGVQSEGVGTAIKHFICNDSEFERTTISSEVSERVLREIYLPPFQAAIQEAKSWLIMASYNQVNGTFASESPYFLRTILREEWGFDGVVVSDWFASVKSTAPSVNAGLDLEMPGPPLWRGAKLLQAVENGEVTEATLDESVLRLLHLLVKTGCFEHAEEGPEQSIDRSEHRALARSAATEGIVLLRNERQVLPLQREHLSSLAIIGPNAKQARIMAGGSAQVTPHYAVTPFDGILAKVGDQFTLNYELGCPNYKLLSLLKPEQVQNAAGEPGFTIEYFNDSDFSGAPVWTDHGQSSEIQWFGPLPEAVNAQQFVLRSVGQFTPQETGTYTFSLTAVGQSRLSVDGQEILDNWAHTRPGESYFSMGTAEVRNTLEMQAGRSYTLTFEYRKSAYNPFVAVRLGCQPPFPTDAIERAAQAAASSDVALVFVGLNGEWESEGFDRPHMDLVGDQDALIERVAAANPNTVVVLNTGSPVTMPWLDKVAAVVQTWFPGQECGNAIADVLFGTANPSGKLPQTFPVRLEDNPAYINYPGDNGKVYYGEGLFVGYRYYEKKKVAPLFPFGFGLSYTTFAYSDVRLNASEIGPDDTLSITLDVTNTGERAGAEIVQLYIHDSESRLHRPEKELKAFAKVYLEPGEHQAVTLTISRQELAFYDDQAHAWIAEAGEFTALVGSSSQDIRATAHFTLKESGGNQ